MYIHSVHAFVIRTMLQGTLSDPTPGRIPRPLRCVSTTGTMPTATPTVTITHLSNCCGDGDHQRMGCRGQRTPVAAVGERHELALGDVTQSCVSRPHHHRLCIAMCPRVHDTQMHAIPCAYMCITHACITVCLHVHYTCVHPGALTRDNQNQYTCSCGWLHVHCSGAHVSV